MQQNKVKQDQCRSALLKYLKCKITEHCLFWTSVKLKNWQLVFHWRREEALFGSLLAINCTANAETGEFLSMESVVCMWLSPTF